MSLLNLLIKLAKIIELKKKTVLEKQEKSSFSYCVESKMKIFNSIFKIIAQVCCWIFMKILPVIKMKENLLQVRLLNKLKFYKKTN